VIRSFLLKKDFCIFKMSSLANAGNFLGLKGENCTLIKIRGVEELRDKNGNDLLKLIKEAGSGSGSGDSLSSELTETLAALSVRLESVENYLRDTPMTAGKKGTKGEKGEIGPEGSAGRDGLQGARGKVEKIQDILDVNLDGLEDGGILVWSADKKKWVVSLE
jgi:hypothetical protein